MEATYRITAEDYREAFSTYKSPIYRWILRILIPCEALVSLYWLRLLIVDPNNERVKSLQPVAGVFIISLVLLPLLPYIRRRDIRKQLEKTPSADSPVTMTVMDSALRFRSEYNDATVAWTSFTRWAEAKSVFALYTAPKAFIMIPKRGFKPEDLDQFRETLQLRIPER